MIHAKLLMEENSSGAHNSEKQADMEREEGMMSSSGAAGMSEMLRKLRLEIGGQVCIPDTWGQESSLQDWADCTAFSVAYVPACLMSAQAALAEERRPGKAQH
jgi:hypothetical protein